MSGARAAMMVAGTAIAVMLALLNDRRLTPVFVEAAPQPFTPALPTTSGDVAATLSASRNVLVRSFLTGTLMACLAMAAVASMPAVTTIVTTALSTSSEPAAAETIAEQETRPAAGVAGNWERAYAAAAPPIGELGEVVVAGAREQHFKELEAALNTIAAQRRAEAARQSQVAAAQRAPATSLNRASGLAPGTILRSRITIYGCTGPGGGFCGNMAAGVRVFEGAAACSRNLPFGTKFKIHSDPTGRVYECLDRGALSATWVDIFFYNTSEGIRWQSLLGGTTADIEIVN